MNSRINGFTLIEILIAVAIIGILAGIAVPQYGAYLTDSRRTDGHVALQSAAQALERCRTQEFSYENCDLSAKYATSAEGHYDITVANRSRTAFELTAEPAPAGPQANDTDCLSMTLNAKGERDSTSGDECW